ncbi:MAG: hypothetical protein ACR2F6_13100 [Mycobacteriales bacterium]
MSGEWIDTTGDGVGDEIAYDTNADGAVDAVYFDANADGVLDTVVYDNNEDGQVDLVSVDTNEDGVMDVAGAPSESAVDPSSWLQDMDNPAASPATSWPSANEPLEPDFTTPASLDGNQTATDLESSVAATLAGYEVVEEP